MTRQADDAALTLGELVGLCTLGQDNAFGQPLESQLRTTLLASWFAESAQLPADVRESVYWVGQLRYVGCTGHAHEVAVLFGDEIATRARTLLYDAGNPAEVLRDALTHGHPDQRGLARIAAVASILAGGRRFAEMNFRTGCEVADMIATRLHMPAPVLEALRCTFERWNGKGQPRGVKGDQIPLAMRVVHIAQDVEALARLRSPAEAVRAVRQRAGRSYDPELADAFLAAADDLFGPLEDADPWDAVLAREPQPALCFTENMLDEALTVVADFIDLKSPYTAGHSRQVAALAAAACELAGLPPREVNLTRRAGLLHDFGRTAIPNSIWDKPAALTKAEHDRVELHPLLTEQALRRSSMLAQLNEIAGSHHERADGSGYVRGLRAEQMGRSARILGAADRYQAMTQPRSYREALSAAAAAAELRRIAADGQVDAESTECVLAAAGHQPEQRPDRAGRAATPAPRPRGLTEREVEVLRLIALGLTTKGVAQRLTISPKTADSHIQHIYAKIGSTTRGAAALFAMQHDLVG